MEQKGVIEYPAVKKLSVDEQRILQAMIDAFQGASQETIFEGEGLLKMCDGCAFKKGTEANSHPITALVSIESILKEEPFYCHKRMSASGCEKLCNGWINVMNNK